MTGTTKEMLAAFSAKAAVLRERGKNNTLHDIEQAADYLDAAVRRLAALSAPPAGVVKPLSKIDVLREWFGGDRYARDYEYIDANFGRQAQQVADYSARIMSAIEPAGVVVETVPPSTHVAVEDEIARVVQSVNEWDDRTSPDDYPEHLLITSEELADLLRNFAATLATTEGSEG